MLSQGGFRDQPITVSHKPSVPLFFAADLIVYECFTQEQVGTCALLVVGLVVSNSLTADPDCTPSTTAVFGRLYARYIHLSVRAHALSEDTEASIFWDQDVYTDVACLNPRKKRELPGSSLPLVSLSRARSKKRTSDSYAFSTGPRGSGNAALRTPDTAWSSTKTRQAIMETKKHRGQ